MAEDGKQGGGSGGANILMMIIGGGLALAAVAIGVLLLISSSHMTMPAKCSPLEDPVMEERIRDKTGECFEFDTDVRVDAKLKKKDKRCDKQEPDIYRSSVRVEGAFLPLGRCWNCVILLCTRGMNSSLRSTKA